MCNFVKVLFNYPKALFFSSDKFRNTDGSQFLQGSVKWSLLRTAFRLPSRRLCEENFSASGCRCICIWFSKAHHEISAYRPTPQSIVYIWMFRNFRDSSCLFPTLCLRNHLHFMVDKIVHKPFIKSRVKCQCILIDHLKQGVCWIQFGVISMLYPNKLMAISSWWT